MRYGPQAERDRLAEIMEYMDEDNYPPMIEDVAWLIARVRVLRLNSLTLMH